MIRKTILQAGAGHSGKFVNLEALASFEVSSGHSDFPFENALRNDRTRWKAGDSGPQVLRINFDAPQTIVQITLEFDEEETSRTQEFSILWRKAGEETWSELRRQQFNFSPGTSKEIENVDVNSRDVTALELRINPSISSEGFATLTSIHIR